MLLPNTSNGTSIFPDNVERKAGFETHSFLASVLVAGRFGSVGTRRWPFGCGRNSMDCRSLCNCGSEGFLLRFNVYCCRLHTSGRSCRLLRLRSHSFWLGMVRVHSLLGRFILATTLKGYQSLATPANYPHCFGVENDRFTPGEPTIRLFQTKVRIQDVVEVLGVSKFADSM